MRGSPAAAPQPPELRCGAPCTAAPMTRTDSRAPAGRARSSLCLLLALALSGLLAVGPRALSAQGAAQTGGIVGTVVDAVSGQPLPATRVRLVETGRSDLSHREGVFHFTGVAAGSYTVSAQRLGYAPVERQVRIAPGETVRLTLEMTPSAVEIEGVVVTGIGRARRLDETYRPTSVVEGAALRRQLGSSVAATLDREPGIAQRYNGPAAAQPVIRGLSGDRVLMLEDGNRTGDIASTAADHAVTIDPLTAERIEVVRGPAGLLYGSNALGGVINVIREEVPRTVPERVTGTASAQAESVNRGATAGAAASAPLGPLAVRGELSLRRAGDTRTPLGPLGSTGMEGYNAGLGASWVHHHGFTGVAGRHYALTYGVPGTFQGETIPGAHEGGVTIDLRRSTVRADGSWLYDLGPFRSIEASGNFVRFEQTEIEPGGFVGTRFGQLSGTGNLLARHEHEANGLQIEGAVGAWVMGRDFAVSGGSTGSHPADQVAGALFLYEEFARGPLNLEIGARYDWSSITPRDVRPGAAGVRARTFGALSGSAAATWEVRQGVRFGASLARAFRTPSIEELFSDGPHLADYSYNIGNPDLAAEYGLGTDLFLRVTRPGLRLDGSVFRNAISNYIYHAPTGELDPRFGRFPVYRAAADDAVLTGAEARAQWEVLRGVVLDGAAGYVHGQRREGSEPLPAIPPLNGSLEARWEGVRYSLGLGWRGAAEQNRVTFPETPTPGYSLLNANAGLRWTAWDRMHTLTLQVENLTDAVWRDHLSRIRAVAPQPGRNVQLLYRVNF
jgi:iron complex outermembrane recepter protein